MTTPTEKLLNQCGIAVGPYGDILHTTVEELGLFRSAVEAESDAERMKQPAVAYRYEYETDLNGDKQGFWPYEPVTHVVFSDKKLDRSNEKLLYAKPFPSTEQLQAQLEAETKRANYLQEQCNKVNTVKVEQMVKAEQLQHRVKELEDALELQLIGSCTCLTKTPDHMYHSAQCKYRIGREALANTQGDKKCTS